MSIFVIAGLSFFIGFAIATLLWTGTGDYLIDAAIAIPAFAMLTWPAALTIVAIQYSARRLPYPARACVNTFGMHPLLVPVLFPGAVEHKTLDTPPAPKVEYEAQVTSSGRKVARDAYRQDVLGRSIREKQAILQQYAGRPVDGRPDGRPAEGATIPITTRVGSDDAELIAHLLSKGLSVSKIAEQLPGFHPRKRQEFKARVRAVQQAIAQQKP